MTLKFKVSVKLVPVVLFLSIFSFVFLAAPFQSVYDRILCDLLVMKGQGLVTECSPMFSDIVPFILTCSLISRIYYTYSFFTTFTSFNSSDFQFPSHATS